MQDEMLIISFYQNILKGILKGEIKVEGNRIKVKPDHTIELGVDGELHNIYDVDVDICVQSKMAGA
jgi:hypothetical protein